AADLVVAPQPVAELAREPRGKTRRPNLDEHVLARSSLLVLLMALLVHLRQRLRETQIREEEPDTAGRRAGRDWRQVLVGAFRDRRDEMHLRAGAGYEHIQTSATLGATHGAETAVEAALRIGTVGRADDDVVALVALDVLEVLDEQPLERPMPP